MRERRFGVEIECGINRSGVVNECTCECYCDGEYDRCYCFDDCECQGDYSGNMVTTAQNLLNEHGFEHWAGRNIHCDGTGVEIPSPILQGYAGLMELRNVLKLLRDNGGYVTRSDGFHVHHDAPEFVGNQENCNRIAEAWAENQGKIDPFVADYRTENYWACSKTLTPESVARMKDGPEYTEPYYGYRYANRTLVHVPGGRGALNLNAVNEHGSIEFRQMEGTLDFDVASAWIRFGQAFIDSVLGRKRVLTCSDSVDLLKKIKVSGGATKVLLEKAAIAA